MNVGIALYLFLFPQELRQNLALMRKERAQTSK